MKKLVLISGFFVVLISIGVFLYTNNSNLSAPENKIILEYTNSGGIIGICDYLQIYTNNNFLYKDPCRTKADKQSEINGGLLSPEEIITLDRLIKQFGVVSKKWDNYKETGMIDGFAGHLEFYGKNNKNPNQNQEEINKFAQNIITRVRPSAP